MRIKYLIISFFIIIFPGLNPWILRATQQSPKETIKIGLLIPDNKSLSAKQGAELAILLANQKAGTSGKHYTLEVKSLEGPWGTGSKQAVSLIFDDKVSAIMASCDGRNAHLIEQVATKSRVVFLSAWSGDPTLSKAFVPWFFNCVPDFNQQADAFIDEIYSRRKLLKIAVISDSGYDSELACECFIKKSVQAGKPEPLKLSYNSESITEQLKKQGIEGIILFGNSKIAGVLPGKLKTMNSPIRVYGSPALFDEELSEKDFENVTFISPGINQSEASNFRKEYLKTYGTLPDIFADYAYDGMNLLIQATGSAGTERENIQEALLKMKSEGVTGIIKFDEKGKRVGIPVMIQFKNGEPVPVEK